jgi:predicted acylesterase/phospholipase RssA
MPSLPETLLRSMLMASASAGAAARQQAAVVVTPDTRGIGLLEFHQIDRAVDAGRAAGRAAVDALAEHLPR